MLALLAVDPATFRLDLASQLRHGIEEFAGRTVWLDAVSVASAAPDTPEEQVQAISLAIGAALDALDPASWRASLVTIPESLSEQARSLAFWLKRKGLSRCYLVHIPPHADRAFVRRVASDLANARLPDLRPLAPPPPRISTARLVLTIPDESLARGYFDEIIGSAMFDTLVWEGPSSPAELAEFAHAWARDHARGNGTWVSYGVIETASNLWIGTVGSRSGDRDPGRFTLGYNLAVRFHGRGYGVEAVGTLVNHLFMEKHAMRVDADVFVDNIPSKRLLERLGFRCEGTLRSMYPKRTLRRDAWVFSLLRQDWLARQPR